MVGKGTLDGREDGTTRDTHNKKRGTTAGVAAKTGSGDDEDDGVEDRFEEHDEHEADHSGKTLDGSNADTEDGGNGGVNHEKEGS